MAGALALTGGFALAQDQDPSARLAAIGRQQTALTAQAGIARNRDARLLTALLMFRRDPPPPLIAEPGDALRAVDAAILIKAMTPALAARATALADRQARLALLRRQAAAGEADAMARQSQSAEDGAVSPRPAPLAIATTAPAPPGAPALRAPVAGALEHGYSASQPGLMFEARRGARVVSPAAGRVVYAGNAGGGLLVVILDLGGDYRLVLSGLQKTQVSVGDRLAAGATLGALPAAAPDLYLELRSGERPVDPSALMR